MENQLGLIAQIAEAFQTGGIWMYSITIVQIVSIAIIIERYVALYVFRHRNQTHNAMAIDNDIRRGNLDNALSQARTLGSGHPIANVAVAGIQAAQALGGREEIQAKMDEILIVENAHIEKRTGFLAMLANVGTLLGLLGTIIGLIQAFSSVTSESAATKAAILTRGVALAMNTTAYGLIMAIPALIAYSVFQNRTGLLIEDLNRGALRLYNSLSFNVESVAPKKARHN